MDRFPRARVLAHFQNKSIHSIRAKGRAQRLGSLRGGCRCGARAFFVHGLAKSDRANITPDELAALKELASEMLAYDEATIDKAVARGPLIEVNCDA